MTNTEKGSLPTRAIASSNECVLARRHHVCWQACPLGIAVVWDTELLDNHTQLVERRRVGFKFVILLFAFYFSHLLFVPFFLFFLSPFGLSEHFF